MKATYFIDVGGFLNEPLCNISDEHHSMGNSLSSSFTFTLSKCGDNHHH